MQPLSDRQTDIVTLARAVGRVNVEDLSARFDVSPQTIRKDLNDLCDRRIMTRVHGGAIIASSVENVGYEARRFIASDCEWLTWPCAVVSTQTLGNWARRCSTAIVLSQPLPCQYRRCPGG